MVQLLSLLGLTCIFATCLCDALEPGDAFEPNSVHANMKFAHTVSEPSDQTSSWDDWYEDDHYSKNIDSPTKDIPIILWWTGRLSMVKGISEVTCPNAICYSTTNRSYFDDPRTRGFYFYGSDIKPEDLPLPRLPYHEWALLHEESPFNNYMLSHGIMISLFNHTATFRRESDYPLTTQNIDALDYLTKQKPVAVAEKNALRKEEGLAPIVYVQTNCKPPSDRDSYVRELMKYIDIDCYGKCLNNKEMPKELRDPTESLGTEKFDSFLGRYKFHLAFENAICNDYMTEKLFRPLHVGSVPIYKGSPLARDWMPDNRSVIMIDDFESPQKLAEFIKYLDSNDTEYERYLQFKTSIGITNRFLLDHMLNRDWGVNDFKKLDMITGFECYVCHKLTERYKVEKRHKADPSIRLLPPVVADISHLHCPQPHPAFIDETKLDTDDSYVFFYTIILLFTLILYFY